MALPSSKDDARAAYDKMVAMRDSIVLQTTAMRLSAAAGGTTPSMFVGFHNFLMTLAPQWDALKNVSGLAAYIQTRIGDASYDPVAAYNAVQAAGGNCVTYIRQNLTQDANGNICMWKLVGGSYVGITYPAAALTSFVTLLDALLTAAQG